MRVSAAPFTNPRQLDAIDALLAASPDHAGLRFARGCALEDFGRTDEAIRAYRDVLERDATHIGALTNLGCLLFERELLAEAAPYFRAALAAHPTDPVTLVNAGRLAAARGETGAAIASFSTALAFAPDLLNAHLGLARVYEAAGDAERAQRQLDRAYAQPRMWTFPYRGTGSPLRVLLIVSASGGDVAATPYLDDQVVETIVLLADSVRGAFALPPHDIVFNAIGDADRSAASLLRATAICASSTAPVINLPAVVAQSGRVAVMERLRAIEGVHAPHTALLRRDELTSTGLVRHGFALPLLLRSPGHHAGMHFARVDDASSLATVAAALPGDALIAIEFVDVRGVDGNVRKYRAVIVDGRLYPTHLAIGSAWKLHYFSADMRDHAEYRAEEARYLADMHAVLGDAGMRALEAIAAALGLDYAGIDFAVGPDGRIVVFEANATMAVYAPSAEAIWDDRRAAGEQIVRAVRAMIRARATRVGS
jgi:glutathione synthase/RimK-type ligase-like ATP-grasp enzyme